MKAIGSWLVSYVGYTTRRKCPIRDGYNGVVRFTSVFSLAECLSV